MSKVVKTVKGSILEDGLLSGFTGSCGRKADSCKKKLRRFVRTRPRILSIIHDKSEGFQQFGFAFTPLTLLSSFFFCNCFFYSMNVRSGRGFKFGARVRACDRG